MKYNSALFAIPRPPSLKRKPMPAENRAAQFAPFAALTGYDEEINEVCRAVEPGVIPADDLQWELERKLNLLQAESLSHPYVELLYFREDGSKNGGAFLWAKGCIRQVDSFGEKIVFDDGTRISLKCIFEIESPLFEQFKV